MKKQKDLPEITEKTEEELDAIIQVIQETSLSDGIKSFVIKCIQLSTWFPRALQKKNISLRRLRTLIFGKGYKNPKMQHPVSTENAEAAASDSAAEGSESEITTPPQSDPTSENVGTEVEVEPKKTAKGHGRMPHTVYQDCREVIIEAPYKKGDPCPTNCGGKLREFNPGILTRVIGQDFAVATRVIVKKMRCNLCGLIVTPEIPPEIGGEKYDASFKAMLALQKYYVATPSYRQEYFQKLLNFPPDFEGFSSKCVILSGF